MDLMKSSADESCVIILNTAVFLCNHEGTVPSLIKQGKYPLGDTSDF